MRIDAERQAEKHAGKIRCDMFFGEPLHAFPNHALVAHDFLELLAMYEVALMRRGGTMRRTILSGTKYPVLVFATVCAIAPSESGGQIADLAQEAMKKDLRERLERLRADASECALLSELATDPAKRELFRRLAEHLALEALELEQIAKQQNGQ